MKKFNQVRAITERALVVVSAGKPDPQRTEDYHQLLTNHGFSVTKDAEHDREYRSGRHRVKVSKLGFGHFYAHGTRQHEFHEPKELAMHLRNHGLMESDESPSDGAPGSNDSSGSISQPVNANDQQSAEGATGRSAKESLEQLALRSAELFDAIKDDEELDSDILGNISKAADMIDSIYDNFEFKDNDDEVDADEQEANKEDPEGNGEDQPAKDGKDAPPKDGDQEDSEGGAENNDQNDDAGEPEDGKDDKDPKGLTPDDAEKPEDKPEDPEQKDQKPVDKKPKGKKPFKAFKENLEEFYVHVTAKAEKDKMNLLNPGEVKSLLKYFDFKKAGIYLNKNTETYYHPESGNKIELVFVKDTGGKEAVVASCITSPFGKFNTKDELINHLKKTTGKTVSEDFNVENA